LPAPFFRQQPVLAALIRNASSLGRLRPLGHLGWARGAIGAAIAIATAGLATWLCLGGSSGTLPWLVAPIGASAVLVFAVPASPLAQPWPVIGGNLLSAAIGMACGLLLPGEWLAGGAAVGLAIGGMSLARCLHPPGGACALLCALGAAGTESWSWPNLLPIAANVLILSTVGWFYNGLTGHPWPHRAVANAPVPSQSLYSREDLDAVLDEWDEVLDVDRDDLDAVIKAVERQALRRVTTRQ
jgi:CBS domain-containing membrane protein